MSLLGVSPTLANLGKDHLGFDFPEKHGAYVSIGNESQLANLGNDHL